MKKQIFILLAMIAVFAISCEKDKTESEMLIGRWELSHEITYKNGQINKEQDYPYEGNTSVFVFEKDESYRYTEVKSLKVSTADTGTYNLEEKKYYSQNSDIVGEILEIQEDKLLVDIYSKNRKTFQRTFVKMKEEK